MKYILTILILYASFLKLTNGDEACAMKCATDFQSAAQHLSDDSAICNAAKTAINCIANCGYDEGTVIDIVKNAIKNSGLPCDLSGSDIQSSSGSQSGSGDRSGTVSGSLLTVLGAHCLQSIHSVTHCS